MTEEEYTLSPEERRFVDELALAVSIGPQDTSLEHRLMKPHDDVLLYDLGFKHELNHDVVWKTLKSGASLGCRLDKTYLFFVYTPVLDFSDSETFHSTNIGSLTHPMLKQMIDDLEKL